MSPDAPPDPSLALELRDVSVWASDGGERRALVRDVDWRVGVGEHWVVLGPNGAGKTSLLSVAGARRQPSEGTAAVLGQRLGATDIRELWRLIGSVDHRLGGRFNERLAGADVVLTGASGTTQPLWKTYTDRDRERARELIALLGCEPLRTRTFGVCSSGERQRLLTARALMPDPALLLLDEPSTGLDLPSREQLLTALADLAASSPTLATVTVTHHVEEIPPSTTHALLLADGAVVGQGPTAETLTGDALTRCFGLPIELTRHGLRYAARAA